MPITAPNPLLRRAAALAAIAAAASMIAAPAHAAGATSGTCSARFAATVSPGFTTTRVSGVVSSNGETGSIVCIGKVGGHRVTGPGTIGFDENYTGDCNTDTSTGTVRTTVPTTGGPKRLVGALTVHRTLLAFRLEVRFPGALFAGGGAIVPLHGTCVLTPLRKILISVTGSFVNS